MKRMLTYTTTFAVALVASMGASGAGWPQPSPSKACLPVSAGAAGLKTFQPREVELSDFCAPDGDVIKSVTMIKANWEISEPWRTDGPGPHFPNRLAFGRLIAHPDRTSVVIETANGIYLIDIAADKPGDLDR